MEYLKLKERKDILKLGIIDVECKIIKDNKGNEVFLEFDLGDIELPLNYNKCVNLVDSARKKLKTQIFLIDKKQDHKGKQLLSFNEEEKMKAIKQFYKEMEIAMDIFLGQGGTNKFLNGKSPYWEMFDDLSEAIEPFMDKMKLTVTDMAARIKDKYKLKDQDSEVL